MSKQRIDLVDDKIFYDGHESGAGICKMFRKNKRIEGAAVKPTGTKDIVYHSTLNVLFFIIFYLPSYDNFIIAGSLFLGHIFVDLS